MKEKQPFFPESEPVKKESFPDGLKRALEDHVMDVDAVSEGNRVAIEKLGDVAFGVIEASVGRCDPELKIKKIALRGGESVVIVGPNGAGKSTVFDAITEKRSAVLNPISGLGGLKYGSPVHGREKLRIARLEQEELFSAVGNLTARETLQDTARYFKSQIKVDWEGLSNTEDPAEIADQTERNSLNEKAHVRIDELMDKFVRFFEMEDFMERKIKDLSGGERTKVALFMMLLSEPDILLLDEPTNHLDLDSISKLVGLFKKYKNAGLSIASISHVQWFLREAGKDGVVSVNYDVNGREVRQTSSSYENYVKDASLPDSQIMRGRLKWPFGAYEYDKIAQRFVVGPIGATVTIPDSPIKEVKVPPLYVGDLVIISGKNGSGKSKFLEAVAKSVSEGDKSGFRRDVALNIAYLPQFWPENVATGTLEDFFMWVKQSINPNFVTPPADFLKKLREADFGARRDYLKTQDLLREPLSKFSGGEQRILWFMAVSSIKSVEAAERGSQYVKESKLPTVAALVLDEPTNHMDQNLQNIVIEAIRDFRGGIMLSTHDINLMEELSKSTGKKAGMIVKPKHLVIEKESGQSTISESKETPADYANRVRAKAIKEAKRLSL